MDKNLTFDEGRAIRLFLYLIEKYDSQRPPFNEMRLPEHQFQPTWIETGSREHALFLFFAAWLSRRGTRANEVYKIAATTINERRYLIDPAIFTGSPESIMELKGIIPRANHTKFGDPVDWWKRALMILGEKYSNDPRELFVGLPTDQGWETAKQELVARHTEFPGIGPKISALNIAGFQEILPADTEYWRFVQKLPVFTADIHVMRLFRMFGIITRFESDLARKVSPEIDEFTSRICYLKNIPHISLLRAMWLIGSNTCDKRRKMKNHQREYCHQKCPMVKYCLGIIPSNTIAPKGNYLARRYLANLRFGEMELHSDRFGS